MMIIIIKQTKENEPYLLVHESSRDLIITVYVNNLCQIFRNMWIAI